MLVRLYLQYINFRKHREDNSFNKVVVEHFVILFKTSLKTHKTTRHKKKVRVHGLEKNVQRKKKKTTNKINK